LILILKVDCTYGICLRKSCANNKILLSVVDLKIYIFFLNKEFYCN